MKIVGEPQVIEVTFRISVPRRERSIEKATAKEKEIIC